MKFVVFLLPFSSVLYEYARRVPNSHQYWHFDDKWGYPTQGFSITRYGSALKYTHVGTVPRELFLQNLTIFRLNRGKGVLDAQKSFHMSASYNLFSQLFAKLYCVPITVEER